MLNSQEGCVPVMTCVSEEGRHTELTFFFPARREEPARVMVGAFKAKHAQLEDPPDVVVQFGVRHKTSEFRALFSCEYNTVALVVDL
jgi:hypothetical protein